MGHIPDNVICPLCDKELRYFVIKDGRDYNNTSPVIDKIDLTHVWSCTSCPFIGLEYWSDNNIKEFVDYLLKK